jgi:hypothetical protein
MTLASRCTVSILVAVVVLFATGCASPRTSRIVVPGERIALDAVSLDAPAEEGWRLSDGGEGYRRDLVLQHEVGGKWDRYLEVHEFPVVVPPPTPADMLRETRWVIKRQEASGRCSVVDAPALEEQFGPFSVSWSDRTKSAPRKTGDVLSATSRSRYFIAPLRLDRGYVVEYGERGEPSLPEFDARARAALDGFKLAPASPEGVGRFAASQPRGSAYLNLNLAVAPFALRGDAYFGYYYRIGVGGFTLGRGSDRGSGKELLSITATTAERAGVATVAIAYSPRVFAVRGPLRIGAGLDLGAETRRDVADASRTRTDLVVGPTAFASVDLRDVAGMTIYMEAEAGAATPGFYRAVAGVGFRAHRRPL